MADVLVEESSLEELGDAIRTVNRSDNTYLPEEMPQAVLDLANTNFEKQIFLDVIARASTCDEVLNLEGTTEIGDLAFCQERRIKKIYANNVERVGAGAFANCYVYLDGNQWHVQDGIIDSGSLEEIVLSKCTELGYGTFANNKMIRNIYIPLIDTIPPYCFYQCTNLMITEIPSTITSIGERAFFGCTNLTITEIPSTITSIGQYTFYSCGGIKTLTLDIPNCSGLKSYTFEYCNGLTDLVIKYVRYVNDPQNIFGYCTNLTTVDFYQDTDQDKIAPCMFIGCTNLRSFIFPPNLTTIANNAFRDCTNLNQIELPDTVTSIESYAFYYCNEMVLNRMPRDLQTIGNYAFYYCYKLKRLIFNTKLKSIGSNAFYNCTGIDVVDLPSSLTTVSSQAFYNNTALQCVVFHGKTTSLSSNAFSNCINLRDIYVPWAQGEVSYAPWGATNATVHYNTTDADFERLYSVTEFDVRGSNLILWFEGSETFLSTSFNILCSDENKEIQWSVPNGVEVIDDKLLRLVRNNTVGNIISVTATPVNNPSLAKTVEIEVVEPSDIFNGANTISLAHSTGVTIESSNIDEYGIMNMMGYESSAGYEGFNIMLSNLEPYRLYELHFDFQVTQGGDYISGYALDYKAFDDLRSDYNYYNYYWENKIDRDFQKHNHVIRFMPCGTTAYLSFNLTALSDDTQNYFNISNFYAIKPNITPLINDVSTRSSGLRLYYDALLNGSDTTKLIDLSGNDNDGISYGITFNTDSFGFSGNSNSYVDCGDVQNALSSFEIYCKPNGSSDYLIFNNLQYGGWYFGIYNYQPRVGYNINGIERYFYYNGPRVTSTEYTHFIGTYDGNSIKLYVNGELGQTSNYVGRITPPRYNTHIILGGGAYQNRSSNYYYNGQIRTARVYARALTAEEVQAHYEYDYNRYENV